MSGPTSTANIDSSKNSGITYSFQDSLPSLPIPELQDSCSRYLDALRPLQGEKEHLESKVAVKEFLKYDGPKLQKKLKEYANGKSNYIEQFWYDSYLNFDNPVVLNLNPFFLLEDDPTPARNNQVTRAASLVVSALSFVRAVRREELQPDKIRDTPLDMYQYSRMFGTSRIPTEHGCQITQDTDVKHMVVMCHGQLYWFDVLDDNSDLIMTEKDVAVNLEAIIEDASEVSIQDAAKGALGILSTENRKIWSGLRDILQREPGSNNAECLHIVDSALFILCLDYTEPASLSSLCTNMLCGTSAVERGVQVGTCMNRWYDKLQIIVCKNGSAGINFEHTSVDGHTVLRFASDVYTDTILRFARSINGQAPSLWASTSPDPAKRDPASFGDVHTTPHKLEWSLVPELVTALRFAETRLADLIGQNEFATLEFQHYGKNFITSMGMSPDAFVQLAFQAAYYGLYGRNENVYEPAMTKAFFHGRTEAIRPVTDESVAFVRTFWGDIPAEQKISALKKACEKHVAVTRQSAKGQGHDRHMYALYCIWQKTLDEAYYDSNSDVNTTTTTSASSSPPSSHTNGGTNSPFIRPSSPHASSAEPTASSTQKNSLQPTASSSSQHQNQPRSRSRSSSTRSTAGQIHITHTTPSLFADAGWDKINTTILSTSNCGNPSLRHFGFGPTHGDGFGLGYIIKDGSLSICASSKHRQTARFVAALEGYFLEIRRLLRATRRRGASGAGEGLSRARELEEGKGSSSSGQQQQQQRVKSRRGRNILESSSATSSQKDQRGGGNDRPGGGGLDRSITMGSITSPVTEQHQGSGTAGGAVAEDSDEEGLGGYGFFDAGMLLTLKNSSDNQDTGKAGSGKRHVGRRLRLAEY